MREAVISKILENHDSNELLEIFNIDFHELVAEKIESLCADTKLFSDEELLNKLTGE